MKIKIAALLIACSIFSLVNEANAQSVFGGFNPGYAMNMDVALGGTQGSEKICGRAYSDDNQKAQLQRLERLGKCGSIASSENISELQNREIEIPTTDFFYSPNKMRTNSNLRNFISKARATDPAGGAQLQQLVNSTDVIGTVSSAIDQVGLDPNNVADVYAVYWIVYWGLANRYYGDPSRASYRAVANQAARGFASSPEFAASSDADKQKMAEELMLNILYFGTIAEEAKTNKAVADQYAKASMEGSRKSGLDLDAMTLTEDGFVPSKKTGDAGGAKDAADPLSTGKAMAANDAGAGGAGTEGEGGLSAAQLALIAAAGGAGLGAVFLIGKASARKG